MIDDNLTCTISQPAVEWIWDMFGNDIMVVNLPFGSKVTWYRRLLTRIFFDSKWTKVLVSRPTETPTSITRVTNWQERIKRR